MAKQSTYGLLSWRNECYLAQCGIRHELGEKGHLCWTYELDLRRSVVRDCISWIKRDDFDHDLETVDVELQMNLPRIVPQL